MENKEIDFSEYMDDCPCNNGEGQCYLQTTYNTSVNDPRYGSCTESLCPGFYWAKVFTGVDEG